MPDFILLNFICKKKPQIRWKNFTLMICAECKLYPIPCWLDLILHFDLHANIFFKKKEKKPPKTEHIAVNCFLFTRTVLCFTSETFFYNWFQPPSLFRLTLFNNTHNLLRDRFMFRNIWERFQWTFQKLFTCDILFVHLCLCMYIGHKTWTFSTFIKLCHSD